MFEVIIKKIIQNEYIHTNTRLPTTIVVGLYFILLADLNLFCSFLLVLVYHGFAQNIKYSTEK